MHQQENSDTNFEELQRETSKTADLIDDQPSLSFIDRAHESSTNSLEAQIVPLSTRHHYSHQP